MIGNNLNLKQLEALVWVADLGSFRRAAHHLNTTQPNISARIASLERSFGVNLMRRDAGSVQMTEKGEAFLKQARDILREADKLVEIAARPDLVDNRLRLGVTELIAATWLRPYMVGMKAAYPNVTVELTVDLSWQLDKELFANALDLTIQSAPFAKSASGCIDLDTYEYVWVANAEIACQLGTGAVQQKELLKHPILTHTRHTQAFIELSKKFERSLGVSARLAPSNSMSAAVYMALEGMGVAIMPRALVATHLKDGSLVEIPYDWRPSPLRFSARFHADKATRFVRHAAEIASECAKVFQKS